MMCVGLPIIWKKRSMSDHLMSDDMHGQDGELGPDNLKPQSADTTSDTLLDDKLDPEKILVLVPENSPYILKLTEDCKNKLREGGGESHTLKFKSPHADKVLRYHRSVHGQNGKWWKWTYASLVDKPSGEQIDRDGDLLPLWSFKKEGLPFLTTMIQGGEYWFNVQQANYKVGTCVLLLHAMHERLRKHYLEQEKKKDCNIAFEINDDGSVSPRDCPETPKLYLGVKGPIDNEKEREQFRYAMNENVDGFQNDNANGHDTLGENVVANCLANRIAAKNLQTPFALGIFGEWGAGKTTFFELMKNRLIEIQMEKVPDNEVEMKYAGHIYCIEFSAWTYHRGDQIMASLMYRILNDLNDQLEIERLLEVSKEGGISSIDAKDKLRGGAKEYLRELLKSESKDVRDEIIRNFGTGRASESLVKVFAKQVEADRLDLNKALTKKKELESEERKQYWKKKIKDVGKMGMNNILRRVLEKVMESHPDIENAVTELEDSQKTLEELFHEKFNRCEQFCVYVKSLDLLGFFTLITVVAVFIFCAWILERYGDILIAKVASILTPLISFFVWVSNIIKRGTDILKEQSEKYANEVSIMKTAAAAMLDIEGGREVDEGDGLLRLKNLQEIAANEKEIAKIQSRLKVLAGQSVHDVVKDRVDSNKYESMLGIVHTVKEDLEVLKNAMFNKYYEDTNAESEQGTDTESKQLTNAQSEQPTNAQSEQGTDTGSNQGTIFPRGKPRIVLFVDDLDRCGPKKVVEVLESLQLLVKSELFVVVAAIDLEYLCSVLEMNQYKDILHSNRCPTGLDYLEKIFQVSYRVPAVISKDNMWNFIDWQICVSANKEVNESDATDRAHKRGDEGEGHSRLPLEAGLSMNTRLFTQKEASLLKESCVLFKLTPRATKRIINVFRMIKEIGILSREKRLSDDDLQRHNLLLLVMAASRETKLGMQKVFNMMETSGMPTFKNTPPGNNLGALVKEQCRTISNSDDFDCVNELEQYTFNNRHDWKKVSANFDLARSFTFFRNAGDIQQE